MALTQRQHSVLAEMGIPVWQQRVPQQQAVVASSQADNTATVAEKHEHDVELQGRCLLVVPSLPLAEAEQSLLVAMLRSISLSLTEVDVMDENTVEQVAFDTLQDRPVWYLGAKSRVDSVDIGLQSDGLETLLSDPMAKARTWQTLKQLIDRLR